MTQTRWQSFIEVNASTAVGFVVSWAATPWILLAFGYQAGPAKSLGIVVVYTALSMVRAWVMRRLFNRIHCPQTTTPQPEGQGDEGKREVP